MRDFISGGYPMRRDVAGDDATAAVHTLPSGIAPVAGSLHDGPKPRVRKTSSSPYDDLRSLGVGNPKTITRTRRLMFEFRGGALHSLEQLYVVIMAVVLVVEHSVPHLLTGYLNGASCT